MFATYVLEDDVDTHMSPFACILDREMEAYVVSYRDSREKGGKVIYNLLLLGLGVTLPAFEVGLSMELGETVVVKVSVEARA